MAIDQQSAQEETPLTGASPSQQSFDMPIAKRTGRLILDNADFFVMLVLLWLVGRYYLKLSIPLVVGHVEQFDTSWELDLVAKAHQGIWLGRDAIFTYGPLFQALLSWGPLHRGISLGSFYLYLWVFQYWTIIVALYFTGRFLLRRKPAWVRTFYLLFLVLFWVPIYWILFDIKLLFPLCSFAILLRLLPEQRPSLAGLTWRAAIAASLAATGFLISGDAGAYSLLASVIVLGASLVYDHRRETLFWGVKYGALTGLFFLVWVLAVNVAAGSILDFHFWRASYEVISQYRWSQSVHMLPETVPIFFGAVVLNLAVFFWEWFVHRRVRQVPARARAAWLAMLCFGVLALQSLLVSSETYHVAIGLFPWIALSCALLLDAAEIGISPLRLAGSLAFMLGITAFLTGPNHIFVPRNYFQDRSALIRQHACPSGLYEFDEVCLFEGDFTPLKTVGDFLRQHTIESEPIGVFPYQNVYGFVARRRVAGALVGSYVAAGDYLARQERESLAKARPSWVVYSAEPWQSVNVGVPFFTRTPEIWFYWQRWYQNDSEPLPGLMLLRRDEQRGQHWSLTKTPILAGKVQGSGDGELAIPVAFDDDYDFLRIRLTVRYPLWWKILKVPATQLRIRFEDGEERLIFAIVQPNHPSEIWIYPWEGSQLSNYFSSHSSQWRAGSRPRIRSLSLRFLQMDWISAHPSWVSVQNVETIKLVVQ